MTKFEKQILFATFIALAFVLIYAWVISGGFSQIQFDLPILKFYYSTWFSLILFVIIVNLNELIISQNNISKK